MDLFYAIHCIIFVENLVCGGWFCIFEIWLMVEFPRGTVLLPTLFLIFIDDLLRSTTNKIHRLPTTVRCMLLIKQLHLLPYSLSVRNSYLDLRRISNWGATI